MHSRVLEPCGIIRVHAWDSKAADLSRAKLVLGVAFPKETGTIANGRADILCIGPTDWLVIADDPDVNELLRGLAEAFEGSTYRATNVSQAFARVAIEGPEVRVLLNKGSALDLHPASFPAGRCARTRFADVPLFICCTGMSAFECIVASSYRDYLISWLTDAGADLPFTS
jgi:sarcosine oxidase, subunit gamma